MTMHDTFFSANSYFLSFQGFLFPVLKAAVSSRVLPMKKWVWLGAESNRRHVDFQSTALPTELPSRDRRRVLVASWDFHYAAMWLQGKRSAFRWPTRHCACWICSYNRRHEEDRFHK